MQLIYNYKNLKKEFSKEGLYDLLWNQNQTYTELQNIFKYNKRLFSKLAKEYGISKNTTAIKVNCNNFHKYHFNYDEIYNLYITLQKSSRDIAKLYQCEHSTILKFISDNNITIRENHDPIYYQNRFPNAKYKYIDSNGYIILIVDGERIREHRYVMEQHLKRTLLKTEYVHHLNFDKTNNEIDNLYLFKSDSLHVLYHSYIKENEYIQPNEFLTYYDKYLKNTYDNYDWLYNCYITKNLSANKIAKEIKLSRQTIIDKLKFNKIYELRNPTINQYN